jgi:dipeptidase
MVVQFIAYLVPFLPLYHSSQTFQFINISLFEECVFVLKSQVALNELEPNSTNIMCSLIIEKYINHLHQYELLPLLEFSFFITLKKYFKTLQTQNY